MKNLTIGIDPGTKTAGICALENGAPLEIVDIVLPKADPLSMARELRCILRIYLSHQYREHQVVVAIEDFRPRQLQGAALRVLEVIGILRWLTGEAGAKTMLLQHAEWRSVWTETVMGRILEGKPGVMEWMENLREHELDAAKIAVSANHMRMLEARRVMEALNE